MIFLIASLLLFSPIHAEQDKIEVKFLITDLSQIPQDILGALKSGKEHSDIIKRGFVVQEYLAVTKKNIFKTFKTLEACGIPFGSETQLEDFLFPGKTQEIRLMRKCIKENGAIKEIYQIGFSGPGAISCARIESPEVVSENQMQQLKEIFEELHPEVNYIVRKVYFEILARDKTGRPILASDGSTRTVEVDAFVDNRDGKLVPAFIDGEIKFRETDRKQALALASRFRQNQVLHPSYFGLDVTDQKKIKARNIALTGLSTTTLSLFEDQALANQYHISRIASEFKEWACPKTAKLACEPLSKPLGTYLHKKVLLNAEAFGFGPTAAIAEIFPYLRDRVAYLSYIGTGLSLNLQSKLPYDKVYDNGDHDPKSRKEKFLKFAKDYDVFITASDYEAAEWAKSLGLKLIVYDPLTWYWATLPPIIREADFYVAQNFFGVAERLEKEADKFPENTVVPAIVSDMYDPGLKNEQSTLLVNMGGLSNPYIKNEDLIAFAKIVFSCVRDILEPEFKTTSYVTSQSIAEAVQDICPAKNMQPHQIQKLLSGSNLAFMTSGLGNIYEASAMHKKIIWLPPVNDSQGQQMVLLKQHHMLDFGIDWSDLFEPIDYFAPQKDVLKQIAQNIQNLSSDPKAQARFKFLIQTIYEEAKSAQEEAPALAQLASTFETGGAKQAAESILQWIVDN